MTDPHSKNEDISIKDIALKLINYKNILFFNKSKILIISLLFGALGIFYSISKEDTYEAHLTFVIDENQDAGGFGALSGMASQFGFNIGSNSAGTFSQTNIQKIITSRRVVIEALLTKGIINGKKDLLINHHIDFNEHRLNWKNTDIENLYFTENRDDFTIQHDSIIGLAYQSLTKDNISINIEDDSNIFKISCVSKNEDFAKLLVESITEKLEEYYILFETAKSKNTLDFLTYRSDSILDQLKKAEYKYASYKDANFGVQRAKGLLEEIRLQRDVEILNIMYGEVVKNLEISKFTLLNNKPLINIIDKPKLPLKVNRQSIIFSFIFSSILGGFLISFYLILIYVLKEELS